jgi:glycosyltransferase involved in cell wall biosynthesis
VRVLNVSSALSLRSGGGTAERTFQMSRSLGKSGYACTVLTLDIDLDSERVDDLAPATVVALKCLWQRFYVPRPSLKTVCRQVNDADMIHLIGHWGILNVLVYATARAAGKPYVVCPAGALPLFGRSAWLKRLYNLFVGHAIIRHAAAWIAVTPSELAHFEAYGIPAASVSVIPNGVSEEDFPALDRVDFLRKHGLADEPIILFVGRLNPIKGPDLLLESFAQMSSRFPRHQLVFVGSDGGMLTELRARTKNLRLADRVHFLGHLEGLDKAGAYQAAQLLVIPSRQEAMSIVALEAGICGTPVLLTDQCGFDEIAGLDARLVVAASSEDLGKGLEALLKDDVGLRDIGARTKAFVLANYAWHTIIKRYLDLYLRIVGIRPIP